MSIYDEKPWLSLKRFFPASERPRAPRDADLVRGPKEDRLAAQVEPS